MLFNRRAAAAAEAAMAPEVVKRDEDYSLQSFLFGGSATTASAGGGGGGGVEGSAATTASVSSAASIGAGRASILTYTPTAEDVGCYIILEVTPVSARFGSGMAVAAKTAAPIAADTPTIPHAVLSFTPQGAAMLPHQPRASVVVTPSQNPHGKGCCVGDRLQVSFSVTGMPLPPSLLPHLRGGRRSRRDRSGSPPVLVDFGGVGDDGEEAASPHDGSKVIVRWQRSSNNIDFVTFATEVIDLETAAANYAYFRRLLSGELLPDDPHRNLNSRVRHIHDPSAKTSTAPAAAPATGGSADATSTLQQQHAPIASTTGAVSSVGLSGFLNRSEQQQQQSGDGHSVAPLVPAVPFAGGLDGAAIHQQRTITAYATALYKESTAGAAGAERGSHTNNSSTSSTTALRANTFMAFLYAGPELATSFVRAELVPVRSVDVAARQAQQFALLRSLERAKARQLAELHEASSSEAVSSPFGGGNSVGVGIGGTPSLQHSTSETEGMPKRLARRIRFAEELIHVFGDDSGSHVVAGSATAGVGAAITAPSSEPPTSVYLQPSTGSSAGGTTPPPQSQSHAQEGAAAAAASADSFVGPSVCTVPLYVNSPPATEAVLLEMIASGGWRGRLLAGPRSNVSTFELPTDVDAADAATTTTTTASGPTPAAPPQPQQTAPQTAPAAEERLRMRMRASLVHVDVSARGLSLGFPDGTRVVAPWPMPPPSFASNSAPNSKLSSGSGSAPAVPLLGAYAAPASLAHPHLPSLSDGGRARVPYYLSGAAASAVLSGAAAEAEAVSGGAGTATSSGISIGTLPPPPVMAGPTLHIPPLFPVRAADAANGAFYAYGTTAEALLFDTRHTVVLGPEGAQPFAASTSAAPPPNAAAATATAPLSPPHWAYAPYNPTTLLTAATIPPPPSCSDRTSTNVFLTLPPTSVIIGGSGGGGVGGGRGSSPTLPPHRQQKRTRGRSVVGGRGGGGAEEEREKEKEGGQIGGRQSVRAQIDALFANHRPLSVEVVFNTRPDRDVFVSLFQCLSVVGTDRPCVERVFGAAVCASAVYPPTLSRGGLLLAAEAGKAAATIDGGGQLPATSSAAVGGAGLKRTLSSASIASDASSANISSRGERGGKGGGSGLAGSAGLGQSDLFANRPPLPPAEATAMLLRAYGELRLRFGEEAVVRRQGCLYGLLTLLADNRSHSLL